MQNKTRILFEAERMKYPFTGIYSYCHFLGKSILKEIRQTDYAMDFYLPKKEIGAFGSNTDYVEQNPLHKFYFPIKNIYKLWHNTYQSSNYFPSKSSLPVLLTIHDLNFLFDKQKSVSKRKKYLANVQRNIERSAYVVAISQSTLNDVNKHLDLKGKPASVIYNGCSLDEIKELKEPSYRPTAEFLFTIGTILAKKNFHVLPALLKDNNMQLIIAGITSSEAYKNLIIEEAKKHGVERRIVFVGAVSENDKQWYYKNCKAFVFPSISEGFGLPVVEAMHFGKPVVLSKKTCLPEIGGAEAYYFDNFEPDTMKQTLINALNDFEINNKSDKIIKRANTFSWDKSAKDFINVYGQILNQ